MAGGQWVTIDVLANELVGLIPPEKAFKYSRRDPQRIGEMVDEGLRRLADEFLKELGDEIETEYRGGLKLIRLKIGVIPKTGSSIDVTAKKYARFHSCPRTYGSNAEKRRIANAQVSASICRSTVCAGL